MRRTACPSPTPSVQVFIRVTGVGRVSAVPYVLEMRRRGQGVDEAIAAYFENHGALPGVHDR